MRENKIDVTDWFKCERAVTLRRYLVIALETASTIAGSEGKPVRVFSATLTPSTHTVNSPRPPGSISAPSLSLSLMSAATREARGS